VAGCQWPVAGGRRYPNPSRKKSEGLIMLGIYILAAMLGGGLLVFSVLSGAHHDVGDVDASGLDVDASGLDADVPHVDVDVAGADVHVGVDADHDFHPSAAGAGGLVLGLFRPRNIIFFLAGFGLTGTLLTLTGTSPDATLFASLGMGGGAMLLTHSVFTWLRRSEVGIDTVSEREMEGRAARVVLPLVPGERGRVVCLIADREYYLTARVSKDVTRQLTAGTEVVIVGVEDGVAEVIPFDTLELPPAES